MRLTVKYPNEDIKQKQHVYEIDDSGNIIRELGKATSLYATKEIHEKVKEYQEYRKIHQVQATKELIELGLGMIKLHKDILK